MKGEKQVTAILRFEMNVPAEVALKHAGPGKPIEGRYGTRVMYTLADNRVMYVAPIVATRITDLGIQPGELFQVCKLEKREGQQSSSSGKSGDLLLNQRRNWNTNSVNRSKSHKLPKVTDLQKEARCTSQKRLQRDMNRRKTSSYQNNKTRFLLLRSSPRRTAPATVSHPLLRETGTVNPPIQNSSTR